MTMFRNIHTKVIFLRTFLNICKQFSREKVSAQMAREVTLAVFKIIGWVALEVVIDQGNSVLSKRKKRDYFETPGTIFYNIYIGFKGSDIQNNKTGLRLVSRLW